MKNLIIRNKDPYPGERAYIIENFCDFGITALYADDLSGGQFLNWDELRAYEIIGHLN